MTPTFLDYEITLILAKYGKRDLLDALSRKLDLSTEELESLLKKTPSEKSALRSRQRSVPEDPLAIVLQANPVKAEFLRILHDRFQNRTFLPELRDVRRFFEQHSQNLGATKSRAESLPRLLKLMAALDREELDALCQEDVHKTYSSLGVISEEILRPRK